MKEYKINHIIHYADYCKANNIDDVDDSVAKKWITDVVSDFNKDDADPKEVAMFFNVSNENAISEIAEHNYEVSCNEDSIEVDHDTKFIKGVVVLKV
jgi:hypothetical protein